MKDALKKVHEFHEIFDTLIGTKPQFPDEDTRQLRRNILEEEFKEYQSAEAANDLIEVADALADIIYIALGTAISYGIPLDEVFNEVHASNMSKLDENGKPIYREDGKVLKGPNYFKPNIVEILERK